MTFTASHLSPCLVNIDGMPELKALRVDRPADRLRSLGDNRMTCCTFVCDSFSTCTGKTAIMTAVATGTAEMPDIARIGVPAHLHLGEEILAVNLLRC